MFCPQCILKNRALRFSIAFQAKEQAEAKKNRRQKRKPRPRFRSASARTRSMLGTRMRASTRNAKRKPKKKLLA